MRVNFQFPADLLTFTEEILNGKVHFLCGDSLNSTFGETFLRLVIFSTFSKFQLKD